MLMDGIILSASSTIHPAPTRCCGFKSVTVIIAKSIFTYSQFKDWVCTKNSNPAAETLSAVYKRPLGVLKMRKRPWAHDG